MQTLSFVPIRISLFDDFVGLLSDEMSPDGPWRAHSFRRTVAEWAHNCVEAVLMLDQLSLHRPDRIGR